MAIRQDITGQRHYEEKILHDPYHNELTGPRNCRYLSHDITKWIEETNDNKKMALLVLAIDHFKYINDSLAKV